MLLLTINDGDYEKYYYFTVKSKLELYSSEWLRNKKEAIINGDNCSKLRIRLSKDTKKTWKKYQKLSHILVIIAGMI